MHDLQFGKGFETEFYIILQFYISNKYAERTILLLKIMINATKNFDILVTSLSILHNYFDSYINKITFFICI